MEKEIKELYINWFRDEKGYNDWNDEEILTAMNDDDIQEFLKYVKINLGDIK